MTPDTHWRAFDALAERMHGVLVAWPLDCDIKKIEAHRLAYQGLPLMSIGAKCYEAGGADEDGVSLACWGVATGHVADTWPPRADPRPPTPSKWTVMGIKCRVSHHTACFLRRPLMDRLCLWAVAARLAQKAGPKADVPLVSYHEAYEETGCMLCGSMDAPSWTDATHDNIRATGGLLCGSLRCQSVVLSFTTGAERAWLLAASELPGDVVGLVAAYLAQRTTTLHARLF